MDPQHLRTQMGPLLFDALPDPAFVVSPRGVFLDVNRAAARYLKREPERLVGYAVHEIFPPEQAQRQMEVLAQVLETGDPWFEERPTDIDDQRYIFQYAVRALHAEDGSVLGVLGLVRDVTEIVALERRYAALYEGATDALFAIDGKGGIRALNREAEVMSGYSREELEQLKIWDVIDPEEVARLQSYLQARVSGQDAPTQYENRWIHGSGKRSWAEVRISREPIEEGVFQASVRDITERKQLEEMRRDFVHMISHEVKGPLTVIQGFSSALAAGSYGVVMAEQADCLRMITDAGRRIQRMMEQFLTAEKLDSEPWHALPAEGRAVAKAVVQGCLGQAQASGIELAQQLEAAAGIQVCDAGALRQILENLLTNALKYTSRGGRVTVSLERAEGGLCIEVQDTGVGIPADEHERVFQRFYRASTGREQRGSGLGLYICARLAERCGGRFELTSEPGVGSRFAVWLPEPAASD